MCLRRQKTWYHSSGYLLFMYNYSFFLICQLLTLNVDKRIKASQCLTSPWMTVGLIPSIPTVEEEAKRRTSAELRRLFGVAQTCVRFLVRLKNLRLLKLVIDRTELGKRPYRRREVGSTFLTLNFKSSFTPKLDSSRSGVIFVCHVWSLG